jgi:hypothetical protein
MNHPGTFICWLLLAYWFRVQYVCWFYEDQETDAVNQNTHIDVHREGKKISKELCQGSEVNMLNSHREDIDWLGHQ